VTRRKLTLILSLGALHLVLTLWQVLAEREDWPLSRFPMYSELKGPLVERYLVLGVTEHGEFRLSDEQTAPFRGARLNSINHRLEREPGRQRRFLEQLAAKYERRRARAGWPVLQAIRSYTEAWRMRPRLRGMDTPERKLTRATYLPPSPLLARLAAEAAGRAPPPEARPVASGDLAFDLGAVHCDVGCTPVPDSQAAGSAAIELVPPTGGLATCSLHVSAPPGRYALFARLRPAAAPGADSVTVELDGEAPRGGSVLGGHREYLPDAGFVWVSSAPGQPALLLELRASEGHTLTFRAASRVVLDQIWLSASARELPIDNRVLSR
jgi:hypothetical protein